MICFSFRRVLSVVYKCYMKYITFLTTLISSLCSVVDFTLEPSRLIHVPSRNKNRMAFDEVYMIYIIPIYSVF